MQRRQRLLMRKKDLILTDDQKKNLTLIEIDILLRRRGKRISDYKGMPVPDHRRCPEIQNTFILDEMNYDRALLLKEHDKLFGDLNEDQRTVYDTVMNAVNGDKGGLFFVYGYGGTGKTFVWRTLSAAVRSQGKIVLNVASSSIASLLLPGGRTAHSRFNIPININKDSTCSISVRSERAQMIARCSLIIWDEAPMMHKHCFEALDRTMQDIMRSENHPNYRLPFGGKVVVLGGDFRQILPVVNKGKRQDIIRATINSSYLWNSCKVLKLTKNMRLQNCSSSVDAEELKNFAEWIASIGYERIGQKNDGIVDIEIPEDILLHGGKDPIGTIVAATFPRFDGAFVDPSILEGRAILAPTLDLVDEINDYMSDKNSQRENEYLSSDSAAASEKGYDLLPDVHTPEYLNSLKSSGVPNHRLVLKIGTPVMLLRNIDHSMGLCNGTRLIITELWDHILEAQIISGTNSGTKVLLPRMTLTPSDSSFPFTFKRRQFPLIVCYAMTINKSQGQSLSNVGLFLRRPVFSHGQFYVAVSRVTNRNELKILICDKNGEPCSVTTNVVFKKVFRNV